MPRVTVALALLLVPAAPAALAGQVERQIQENQARLDSIRGERERLEDELTRLRGRLRNISSELTNIEQQKRATTRLVNELDRQMLTLTTQLDTITLDLLLAQDALQEKRAIRERRVVEIYKRGPLWAFQVLLAAETFSDLLSRYKYLYLVSRQDQALVADMEALRDRIARERRQLATAQNALEQSRQERASELRRYVQLERQRQRSLQQARASQERTSEQLTELERSEQQLTALINALERRRREAIAAGRLAPVVPTITEDSRGALPWPVDGTLLYRYGPAQGPRGTQVMRQGVGIGAPVGTPVRAVASGRVEFVGTYGTYGPIVMINHGEFYTLYMHLSQINVTGNQQVTGGTVVGLSGGQGSDEGPHVEFQIRQLRGSEQIALDPLNWLQGR